MSRLPLRLAVVSGAATVALLLSGCGTLFGGPDNPFVQSTSATPGATTVPTATCNNGPFESVFSAYGSLHYTRELASNLTLILDMYTDQKTHTWYYNNEKHLSFVVKVVDSNAKEHDPFSKKRKAYMGEIDIEANSVTKSGASEKLFSEDLDPVKATLDPEALKSSKYGLLITSPKGGFQREDNEIKPATAADTIGFTMDFTLTISSQSTLHAKKYKTRVYTIQLPVTIFTKATADTSTSCATSSTLAPVAEN